MRYCLRIVSCLPTSFLICLISKSNTAKLRMIKAAFASKSLTTKKLTHACAHCALERVDKETRSKTTLCQTIRSTLQIHPDKTGAQTPLSMQCNEDARQMSGKQRRFAHVDPSPSDKPQVTRAEAEADFPRPILRVTGRRRYDHRHPRTNLEKTANLGS